ncbi:MAG TPA: TatD family hydrolase [Flavisolibacter sp.]|nr:TatD family hydrolase [Flavisolibacter sp.]
MQAVLIDTHAHIYLPEFDDDREKMIAAASAAGLKAIYLPAIDSSTHERMLDTEKAFPLCRSMMGLHPCSVKEDFAKEIEIIKAYLSQHQFIAVGEIGLDFYWDKTFTEQQYAAFHQHIELALQHQLPIVIHSRNAIDECIDVVAQYPGLRGVFHCFSGNATQAEKIIELNFMLGIGGVVTFKNGGLDKVLPQVGLSHLVLETDSPYLAPVPYRGKRNEPAYTKLVADKIALLLNLSVEEVAAITTQNAEKLFSLSQNP